METALEEIQINKYAAYKDSDVEWLEEIPKHWSVEPGLTFLYESREKNKGMKRNTVLSLSYGNIRVKGEDELTGLVPESFETYQLVNKGDIIFRPTDLQNDHVSLRSGISKFEGIITSAYINLRLKEIADPKFYSYFFRAIDNNKVIYGLGSGLRQNIDYRDFRRFPFPFPPKEEQTAIANFLDRKTASIDRAVSIKEKQIELLKERRQILIHKAVTRGLNPNVKMKDSGVEWIGEIPEGWELSKLCFLTFKIGDGLHGTPNYSDNSEYYFINGNNLSTGHIEITAETKTVSEKEYKLHKKDLTEHTLLLSINGTIGNVAYYQGEKVMLGKSAAYLNFHTTINIHYVKSFLESSVFKNYYELELSGSTINNFSLYSVGKTPIILPTTKEQVEIVNRINSVSKKIHTAISLKGKEIEKLKEYKATLINSAVTGKIKVI